MNRMVVFAVSVLFIALRLTAACRSETLSEAWGIALANNPSLAAAQLESAAAGMDVGVAGAQRLPTAWSRGGYTVRSDEQSFLIANPLDGSQRFSAPFSQREAAAAAVGMAMPLYSGGEIKNSVLGAEARAVASGHGVAASRLQLLLVIGEAYLDILRRQRGLLIAEQNLESLVAHQREVQRQFDQQRVARTDLLAAQVATASAEQARLRQTNQLITARGRYNQLLARPLETPAALEEITLPQLEGALPDWQYTAWQQRPELAQLRSEMDARRFDADRLRGAARPHINAVGQFAFEENRFQTPQGISSAGVVVDWRMFDGGKSNRAAAAAQTRAASLGKLADDLRSAIALDVQTSWNGVQESLARIQVAARGFEQAEEGLRVSTLRYERGLTVESEVLDAQTRRTQAASDFSDAGYDLARAQIQLRYAVGILGDGR